MNIVSEMRNTFVYIRSCTYVTGKTLPVFRKKNYAKLIINDTISPRKHIVIYTAFCDSVIVLALHGRFLFVR